MNAFEVGAEDVAYQTNSAALFFIDEAWSIAVVYLGHALFPALHQHLQLTIQFSSALVLGRCAHYHTKVARLNALNKSAQACLFGTILNLLRYQNLIVEWYQHQETACKCYLGGKAWTLGRYGLLRYLYY